MVQDELLGFLFRSRPALPTAYVQQTILQENEIDIALHGLIPMVLDLFQTFVRIIKYLALHLNYVHLDWSFVHLQFVVFCCISLSRSRAAVCGPSGYVAELVMSYHPHCCQDSDLRTHSGVKVTVKLTLVILLPQRVSLILAGC